MNYIDQIKAMQRSKCGAIWTTTREEARAEALLIQAAGNLQMLPFTWTVTTGLYDHTAQRADATKYDPQEMFSAQQRNKPERALYIIKDITQHLQEAGLRRLIKDELTDGRKRDSKTQKLFVFLDTTPPPQTINGILEIPLELPTRDEQAALLSLAITANPEKTPDEETQSAILDSLTGLDSDTARNAILKSLVNTGAITPEFIAKEKRNYVKSAALTWTDPDPRGLEAIGGLEFLKEYLLKARAAMTADAQNWGIPAPKGILLVGIPGGGKSLTAKAAAAAFRIPLIQFDIAAIYGKYVGESEQNMRNALQILDAVSPAVVWIDEIEKALSGTGSEGDGGTAARIFGNFLQWTQERAGKLFILATANDISKLPPELKRTGRFDALFYVGTPHRTEREAIAKVMMKKYPRTANTDAARIAEVSDGYTGAEIERAYQEALTTAYNDGKREPTTEDVTEAIRGITPITKIDAVKMEALKQWAKTSARNASKEPEAKTANAADIFKI